MHERATAIWFALIGLSHLAAPDASLARPGRIDRASALFYRVGGPVLIALGGAIWTISMRSGCLGGSAMLKPLRDLATKPWMDEREYDANLQGIQIVFGAVLGFVLAGAERFDSYDFGVLLLMTISVVVSILYISASKRRWSYAALAVAGALFLPEVIITITGVSPPEKLSPTLLIWTLFQAGIEFAPREKPYRQEP